MRKTWILIAALAAIVIAGVAVWYGLKAPSQTASAPAPLVSGSSAPAPAPANPRSPALTPTDRILGRADAPVTIIEYASLTCPHCAQFHETTLPRLKAEYIDTGKVRLVFRDFPLDQVALRASALAECVPAERYYGFLEILFKAQANWATAPDTNAALARLGKLSGLGDDQANACLNDEKRIDAVVAERLAGEREFEIRSTPTFIIAGTKYTGALTFEQVQGILGPLLP